MSMTGTGVRVLVTIATALGAVGLAACGGDDSSGGGGKASKASDLEIVYSLYDRQAAFFRGCVNGVTEEAEKQGANLSVEVSGPDATKQIQQLENALLTQPDAIILSSIDAAAVEPTLEKITDAGIPVIAICDEFGSIEREPGPGRLSYIGPDYRLMGTKKMEFIVESLREEDELQGAKVASFFGIRGVPFDVAQRAGIDEVVAATPEIEYIKGPYSGEYTATAGLEATQNILAADPDISGLSCDNSDQCLGAVKAISEAGIAQDDILVSSNDAIPPELDAVRSGAIDYTVGLCSFNEGQLAVQQIVDLLVDGKLPPAYTLDAGRDITAPGHKLKTDNIDSVTVDANTEATTELCKEPVIDVLTEEPNQEQADALGLSSDE
jgi:ABC-type sugar transport system substrate-binding protein